MQKLAKISGTEGVGWSTKPEPKWNSLEKRRIRGVSVWLTGHGKGSKTLRRSLWWVQRVGKNYHRLAGSRRLWGGGRVKHREKRTRQCGGKYLQIKKVGRVEWSLEITFWESPELRKFLKQLVQRELRCGWYQGQRTEAQQSWGSGKGRIQMLSCHWYLVSVQEDGVIKAEPDQIVECGATGPECWELRKNFVGTYSWKNVRWWM